MQKYSIILFILTSCSVEFEYISKKEYCDSILNCKCSVHIENDYYICDCEKKKIKIPDICKEEE